MAVAVAVMSKSAAPAVEEVEKLHLVEETRFRCGPETPAPEPEVPAVAKTAMIDSFSLKSRCQ